MTADRSPARPEPTVAALYVDPKGVYAGLEGVEVWDEARDARLAAGVVALFGALGKACE